MKRIAILLVAIAVAACGPAEPITPPDPIHANDVDVPADSAEANGLIEFLNDDSATFEVLDAIIDSRAAEGLVENRPYATIDDVDAVPYVGPVAIAELTAHLENAGYLNYQGGVWEGVSFSGPQVAIVLDLANVGSLTTLDVDAGLDVRAAQNIVDARPVESLNELAKISYVGTSALSKLRAFLPTWQETGSTVEVYDGVVFSHVEATRALAAANDANLDALSSVEIKGSPANIILAGRPWSSLSILSSRAGIGSLTMSRLRTLGEAYADATPYVVTQSDVADFATKAKNTLSTDTSWKPSLKTVLVTGDLTGSTTWADAVIEKVSLAIAARIDTFTAAEVGHSYSSRDAALQGTLSYVANLKLASRTDYPAGVLTLIPSANESHRLGRMKTALLHYWQYEFVGTDEWNHAVNFKTWDDVKGQVGTDIANFENTEAYEVYNQNGEIIFVGRVYGLYNEANVDAVGKVTRIYVEID